MEEQMDGSFDTASNGEDAELYLLKWNSHQNHFANKFSELLDEDDIAFADVTLACEGHFLQAHRLVLSVCSPFFKNLFRVNSAEKGPATIVLANVRFTDLENILHFIYRGQVNVRKDDLAKFLETGEQLQIDGLMGQYDDGSTKPKGNAFKRRYSEGGHILPKAAPQNRHTSYVVNKANKGLGNGAATASQQYRTLTGGNASRLVSQANHVSETPEKKPRISPTGILLSKESTIVRRPSTTATSANAIQNSSNHSSPQHPTKTDEVSPEVSETSNGNGIKILTVSTMNTQSDDQGNEVFEILDYEEDNEDGAENELDMDEMMASYEDGGEDSIYYTYQQASPQYVRSGTSNSQTTRGNPNVTARYPSIIDGVHFDLISADEKRVAAQCKLCPGDKVIRGSGLTSSNFISHLRAFHKRELEEWREKRKTETRRRLD